MTKHKSGDTKKKQTTNDDVQQRHFYDNLLDASAIRWVREHVERLVGISSKAEEPTKEEQVSASRKKPTTTHSRRYYLIMFLLVLVAAYLIAAGLSMRRMTGRQTYGDDGLDNATVDRVRIFMQKHGKVKTLKGKTMQENVTRLKRNMSSLYWQFNAQISQYALYTMESTNNFALLDNLIHAMATNPIISLESMGKLGSEWKMFGTLTDGVKVVFKPARMQREEDVDPNLYYFSEKERHTGEIAAFHLDRILGFNRVPPCVGRVINITSEMIPFIDDQFMLTIHRSPSNNLCFYGQCIYLCDLFHPICGSPDTVEFSACSLIPHEVWRQSNIISPWRRAYMVKNHKIAEWEKPELADTYCETHVMNDTMYSKGRRLLDLVDLHVFDFLTGNQDRHSYFVYKPFENDSSMINYDNGRGFGRPYIDDLSILAPIINCCRIRQSTYEKIVFLAENNLGVRLSSLLRRSLSNDPLWKIEPILNERHFEALDRRVKLITQVIIADCLMKRKLQLSEVVVNDGF